MRPMIDELELPQVQEIDLLERRALAEHRAPGMDGSLLQNLGREAACLALWGVASGPEALDFSDRLDAKFRAGEPVTFIADIAEDSEIERMVIDDLRFQELAGKLRTFAFALTLREHLVPVEPAAAAPLDGELLEEAQGLIDELVEGLDLGFDFATGLERFVSPLQGLLERLERLNQGLVQDGG
jgi:hypothetical protein